MYFKPGMTVRVNKDIIRTVSYDLIMHDGFPRSRPTKELYAKEGEIGEVLEVFQNPIFSWRKNPHYAKVKIGDKIKTFRLTSLEIIVN